MVLTENCKEYIAQYLGIIKDSDFCFSDTTAVTVKYWDPQHGDHMGSTVDVVSTIIYGGYSYEDTVALTGKIDAAKLTSENGGTALGNDDIIWIANNSDGVAKYCKGAVVKTGFLTVTTSPVTGASVSINGTSCGTTPVTACVVPVGTGKTVTISKAGYQTETRTVTITEEETMNLGTIVLTEIPIGKGNLCVVTTYDMASVYVDIDVNPNPNTDLSPSRKEPYPDGTWPCTEVTAPANHIVTVKKIGYKDAEISVDCIEGESVSVMIPMEPEAGPTVGIVELHAFDAKTGTEINANFDIEGLGGEEKYLTPYSMNIKAGTYDWIRFYCTGFEDYEATNITITEGETTTVNAYMTPKKLWKQVYVGPPILLVVLEGFSIPSRLYWNVEYDFDVTLRCFEVGWYYANIELRDPGTFLVTGDPNDLGATKWTIPLPEKEITFFDINTKVKFETTRVVPGAATLPKGIYIAVVTAYSGKR